MIWLGVAALIFVALFTVGKKLLVSDVWIRLYVMNIEIIEFSVPIDSISDKVSELYNAEGLGFNAGVVDGHFVLYVYIEKKIQNMPLRISKRIDCGAISNMSLGGTQHNVSSFPNIKVKVGVK